MWLFLLDRVAPAFIFISNFRVCSLVCFWFSGSGADPPKFCKMIRVQRSCVERNERVRLLVKFMPLTSDECTMPEKNIRLSFQSFKEAIAIEFLITLFTQKQFALYKHTKNNLYCRTGQQNNKKTT